MESVTRVCVVTSFLLLAACGGGGDSGADGAGVGDGSPPPSDGGSVPTVSLTANQTSVSTGTAVTLTWSSTFTQSCTASGAWSGNRATSGSEQVTPSDSSTTYALTCTGAGGTAQRDITITVLAQPALTFTADPVSLAAGQSSTLTWNTTDATSCTASGGWTGAKAVSGSESVGPVMASTNFVLECSGPGGTSVSSVAISVANASVAGTVYGLLGQGLEVSLNSGPPLLISNNGNFAFEDGPAPGAPYTVTVATQPVTPDQACVVTGQYGSAGATDNDDLAVICTDPAAMEFVETRVLIDAGLPIEVHDRIAQVVTPIDSGAVGEPVLVTTIPGDEATIVLALSAAGELVLAGRAGSGATVLTAESTALALVDLLVLPYVSHLTSAELSQTARLTPAYLDFVSAIESLLSNAETVLESVVALELLHAVSGQIVEQIREQSGGQVTLGPPVAQAIIEEPRISELPYPLADGGALFGKVELASTNSVAGVGISNSTVVAWCAVTYGSPPSPSCNPDANPQASVVAEDDWSLGATTSYVPFDRNSFALSLDLTQTAETREINLTNAALGLTRTLSAALTGGRRASAQCTGQISAILLSGSESQALLQSPSQSTLEQWFLSRWTESKLAETKALLLQNPELISSCVFGVNSENFQRVVGEMLGNLAVILRAASVVDSLVKGANAAYQITSLLRFWEQPDASVGVCLSEAFLPAVCASDLHFRDFYIAPGASRLLVHLAYSATDANGQATIRPPLSALQFESGVPESATLEPAAAPESVRVPLNIVPPFQVPLTAFYEPTGASDVFVAQIVNPSILPGLNVSETFEIDSAAGSFYLSLGVRDEAGNEVLKEDGTRVDIALPAGITWQSSSPDVELVQGAEASLWRLIGDLTSDSPPVIITAYGPGGAEFDSVELSRRSAACSARATYPLGRWTLETTVGGVPCTRCVGWMIVTSETTGYSSDITRTDFTYSGFTPGQSWSYEATQGAGYSSNGEGMVSPDGCVIDAEWVDIDSRTGTVRATYVGPD